MLMRLAGIRNVLPVISTFSGLCRRLMVKLSDESQSYNVRTRFLPSAAHASLYPYSWICLVSPDLV